MVVVMPETPAPDTLPALFAARRPTDPATVFLSMPDGAEMTYGELRRGSTRLARTLTRLGVGAGDRVAVQAEKSPLAILLYLACVRSGAVLVPMNPAYTNAEVEFLLADAQPSAYVRDSRRRDVRVPRGCELLMAGAPDEDAPDEDERGIDFEDVAVRPDDLAAIVYTSGTTGRPKGAMLTQRNLASNAATLHRIWGFRPDDVLLHALPVFHVHGLFVATNCVLANGTGMVFLPRFDVDAVLAQLACCTVLMGVPTFYTRLLADPRLDAAACRHMRLFVSGSAPLLATTHEQFQARTGHAILERYGMTETGMITSNPLDGDRRAGTVGPALPDVEVRVVATEHGDDSADEVGDVGDIEVRGPNVSPGYWAGGSRQPAVSDRTVDGFFRTGDVGSFDGDGYLTIVGRARDLVISGGLNIYPKEVEDVLDQIDGVVESAVVGVPDPDFGEVLVAVVVAEPKASLHEDAVRAAARERLAGFKVPKQVRFVGSLPRNAMGKVEKARLRAEYPARP